MAWMPDEGRGRKSNFNKNEIEIKTVFNNCIEIRKAF